jgi:hypothetical protein
MGENENPEIFAGHGGSISGRLTSPQSSTVSAPMRIVISTLGRLIRVDYLENRWIQMFLLHASVPYGTPGFIPFDGGSLHTSSPVDEKRVYIACTLETSVIMTP